MVSLLRAKLCEKFSSKQQRTYENYKTEKKPLASVALVVKTICCMLAVLLKNLLLKSSDFLFRINLQKLTSTSVPICRKVIITTTQ